MKRKLFIFAPLLGLLSGAAIACGVFLLWCWYGPHQRHWATYHRIDHCIDQLKFKRPESLSEREWNCMVGWTRNGVGNCLSSQSQIRDQSRFAQFATNLELRLTGEVDQRTIDWIWDEFEALSTNGKDYSARWRPTLPERREDARSSVVEL